MIKADSDNEGNETFKVKLEQANNAVFTNSASSIEKTFTIIDDDAPTLSFKTTNFETTESDTSTAPFPTFDIIVQLSEATTNPVTFDIDLIDGTATKGNDFTDPVITSYTISATPESSQTENTEVTISIPIKGDGTGEFTETFELVLKNLTGASFGENKDSLTQTITITDDDFPLFTIAESDIVVAEDAGMVDIVLNLSRATDSSEYDNGVVRIAYQTQSHGSTATAGVDYTAVLAVPETILTIQPGQPSGTIRIPILDDEVNEPNEIFNVFLTPKFGVINGDPTRAVFSVTIVDNEVPELSITAVETYIEEEAGAMAEFEISTTIMPHSPIAIQYRPENTSFLADGITGEKQTSQPLTFTQENAGDPYTAKLRIPIVNDDLAEPNGTLKVTLLEEDPDLNNYDLHATNYHATIHIEDDDAKVPVLFVEGSTDGVAETAGTVEFTITAYDDQAKSNSINPERDISVQFTPEEVHSTGFFDNSGTTTNRGLNLYGK